MLRASNRPMSQDLGPPQIENDNPVFEMEGETKNEHGNTMSTQIIIPPKEKSPRSGGARDPWDHEHPRSAHLIRNVLAQDEIMDVQDSHSHLHEDSIFSVDFNLLSVLFLLPPNLSWGPIVASAQSEFSGASIRVSLSWPD